MYGPKNAIINAQNYCCTEKLKLKTPPLPLIAASLFTGRKVSDYNSMDMVTFKRIWQQTQRAREGKRKNTATRFKMDSVISISTGHF